MSPTHDIISELLSQTHLDSDKVLEVRKKISWKYVLAHMPSNADIFKTYFQWVQQWIFQPNKELEKLLRKRAVRSQSGIVPVQVLTKPFWCPWECIFCPNDATMPKSYINTEPGAQRALLNNFDPYKQVTNRLLSLRLTWHDVDKIEMIVLGWTRDVYPKEYKIEFIKGLYDACNTFNQFFMWYTDGSIILDSTKSINLSSLPFHFPQSIEQSLQINETASCRIIWLTIETRPEYVTDENCLFRRSLGVTRVEMGIQSMFDDVLDANKRGHTIEQCRQAMCILRSHSFKISVHLMPGLYWSSREKDVETFRLVFCDPAFRPDEIKFYPTAIIPNTELYTLYKQGKYTALTLEQNKSIIKEVLINHIPPYTRIKRLIRDIPAEETVGTHYVTNLRQLVEWELEKEIKEYDNQKRSEYYTKLYPNIIHVDSQDQLIDTIGTLWNQKVNQPLFHTSHVVETHWTQAIQTFVPHDVVLNTMDHRNFVCFDTRSREIRNNTPSATVFPVIRVYSSTNGLELFMSFEDELWYLYGFTRLLLPDSNVRSALIRELHIYGQVNKIGFTDGNKTQHTWLWWQLMTLAEQISSWCGYTSISVISGVWVRKYYEKLGYKLVWTDMKKDLTSNKTWL